MSENYQQLTHVNQEIHVNHIQQEDNLFNNKLKTYFNNHADNIKTWKHDQKRYDELSKIKDSVKIILPDSEFEDGSVVPMGALRYKETKGKHASKIDVAKQRKNIKDKFQQNTSEWSYSALSNALSDSDDAELNMTRNFSFINFGSDYKTASKNANDQNAPGSLTLVEDTKDKIKSAIDSVIELKTDIKLTTLNDFAENVQEMEWIGGVYKCFNGILSYYGVSDTENRQDPLTELLKKAGIADEDMPLEREKLQNKLETLKLITEFYQAQKALIERNDYEDQENKLTAMSDTAYLQEKISADSSLARLMEHNWKNREGRGKIVIKDTKATLKQMKKAYGKLHRNNNTNDINRKDKNVREESLFFKAYDDTIKELLYTLKDKAGDKNVDIQQIPKEYRPLISKYFDYLKNPGLKADAVRDAVRIKLSEVNANRIFKPMSVSNDIGEDECKFSSKAGKYGLGEAHKWMIRNMNKHGMWKLDLHKRGHVPFVDKFMSEPEYIQKIALFTLEKGISVSDNNKDAIMREALSPSYVPDIQKIKSKSLVASKFFIHKRIFGSEIYWEKLGSALRSAKKLCASKDPVIAEKTRIETYVNNRKDIEAKKSRLKNPENERQNKLEIREGDNVEEPLGTESFLNDVSAAADYFAEACSELKKFSENGDNFEGGKVKENRKDEYSALIKNAQDSSVQYISTFGRIEEFRDRKAEFKTVYTQANDIFYRVKRQLGIVGNVGKLATDSNPLPTEITGGAFPTGVIVLGIVGAFIDTIGVFKDYESLRWYEIAKTLVVDTVGYNLGSVTDAVCGFVKKISECAETAGAVGAIAGSVSSAAFIVSGAYGVASSIHRNKKMARGYKAVQSAKLQEWQNVKGKNDEKSIEQKKKLVNDVHINNNIYENQDLQSSSRILTSGHNIAMGILWGVANAAALAEAGLVAPVVGLALSAVVPLAPIAALLAAGLAISKMISNEVNRQKRVKSVIDQYIMADRVVTGLIQDEHGLQDKSSDELYDMVRREAAAECGCASLDDFYDYICTEYANKLFDDYNNSTDEDEKEGYANMIRSFGVRVNDKLTAAAIAKKMKA